MEAIKTGDTYSHNTLFLKVLYSSISRVKYAFIGANGQHGKHVDMTQKEFLSMIDRKVIILNNKSRTELNKLYSL